MIELAARSDSWIAVRLFWSRATGECIVTVETADEEFVLRPSGENAYDCYLHPYAYAPKVVESETTSELAAA